jgi:hypothetical protein
VTYLNPEQSTGKRDVFWVVFGVFTVAIGGAQLLVELRFDTNQVRLVVGALNLILGAAATVTAWRGSTRGEWVWVFLGLNGLYSAVNRFGRFDPRERMAGTFIAVLSVAALVVGRLTFWQYWKRRT